MSTTASEREHGFASNESPPFITLLETRLRLDTAANDTKYIIAHEPPNKRTFYQPLLNRFLALEHPRCEKSPTDMIRKLHVLLSTFRPHSPFNFSHSNFSDWHSFVSLTFPPIKWNSIRILSHTAKRFARWRSALGSHSNGRVLFT